MSGDLEPLDVPMPLITPVVENIPAPVPAGPPVLTDEQLLAYRNQPGIIVVDSKPKVPANVLLGGRPYRALPLKSLVLINMLRKLNTLDDDPAKMLDEMEHMISGVFGRKVAPSIMERLTDPEDDLDLPDVMIVIRELAKKATGNPTS